MKTQKGPLPASKVPRKSRKKNENVISTRIHQGAKHLLKTLAETKGLTLSELAGVALENYAEACFNYLKKQVEERKIDPEDKQAIEDLAYILRMDRKRFEQGRNWRDVILEHEKTRPQEDGK